MTEGVALAGSRKRVAGFPQGITIAVAGFLPVMAIVALAPAVPSIMRHFASVPHSSTLVPLMVTAPGALIALCAPVAGWVADKVGRRTIIIIATFFYGFLGLLPFFLSHLGVIFASRLCLGVAEAIILTVTNTLLGDYFAPDQRRKWLTIQGVIGPVLGTSTIASSGALTEHFWNGSFLIYLVAFPIFLSMLFFFYEPPIIEKTVKHESPATLSLPFPTKTVLTYCGATLFTAIIFYVFIVQGGLAFDAIGVTSAKTLGRLIGVASLGVPVGALLFGWLSSRWPIGWVLGLTLASFGFGMIGIGLAREAHWMTAASFVQQIGSGMAVPTLIFWVTSVVAPQHRGRGMGWWVCSFFLGQFISPVLVSAAHSLSGSILATFVVMGTLSVLGGGIALLVGSKLTQPSGNEAVAAQH